MAIDILVSKQSIRDGNRVIRDARLSAATQAGAMGHVITGEYSIKDETAESLTLSFISNPAPSSGAGGSAGPTGPAGPKGDKGDKGDIGSIGPSGSVGDIGPAGGVGPQGPAGERGLTGPAGADGAPGSQGPKGDKGDTGGVGPVGPTGSPGQQGQAGPTGPAGSAGAQGPKGDTGLTGATGPAGPAGVDASILRALVADVAGVNGNAAQPIFVGLSAITLGASTAYDFDLVAHITRAAGTTAHTTALSFGGTATLQAIGGIEYLAQAATVTGNVLGAGAAIRGESAAATTVTASSNVATENLRINVTGLVRTNAGGTFIPQFTYSAAPGGVPTIRRNSFIRLTPRGAATVTAVN
jgi:hypothetical protein